MFRISQDFQVLIFAEAVICNVERFRLHALVDLFLGGTGLFTNYRTLNFQAPESLIIRITILKNKGIPLS